MKNLLFALITVLFFTGFACNKSEDQLHKTILPETEFVPTPTHDELQQAPTLPDQPLEKSPLVALINEETLTLQRNESYGFFIRRESLGDPLVKKHQVHLTTFYTDPGTNPNLYIYAYNSRNQAFRFIRKSIRPVNEEDVMSFRSTDLKSTEDRFYVLAHSQNGKSKIKLSTYIRPVDCVEYPVAEPQVLSHGAPAMGCNRVEYRNSSYAFAAGITSWNILIVN